MPEKTFHIALVTVMVVTAISLSFPYQRLNVADKCVRITRIILGAVLLGMAAAGYLLY